MVHGQMNRQATFDQFVDITTLFLATSSAVITAGLGETEDGNDGDVGDGGGDGGGGDDDGPGGTAFRSTLSGFDLFESHHANN